jgi:hypothetical protein
MNNELTPINKLPNNVVYPYTEVQVTPQGIAIVMHHTQNHVETILIDENTCNNMCKMWLQSRKDIRNQLELADRVRKGLHA